MSNLNKFDHLVVVMFENRSFDNLAGYLYDGSQPKHFIPADSVPRFNGVAESSGLSNPGPNGETIPVSRAPYETQESMTVPSPDPGEDYPHINKQLYGTSDVSPDISQLPDPAPMDGFVFDYIDALKTTEGWEDDREPTFDNYKIIMNCFPPEATPVFSGLARSYAISDEWFCSVPSQTFCNRSFFNSGSSHGFVTNSDYLKWCENKQPTIFNRLSEQGRRWRIYWDKQDVIGSLTRLIHPPLQQADFNGNFRTFDRFAKDCEAGDLPEYTFIEPRLFFDHNDMHPPVYLNPFVDSSILAGEILLNDIYNSVVSSPLWERTLLVVTFDEHGGCYDHVPPPLGAIPPDANPDYPLQDGFRFNRFGVRVPTLFISPYIEPATILRSDKSFPFDHTSMIKTICTRWNLPGLKDRDMDERTPTMGHVLTRETPRPDTPHFTPRPYRRLPEETVCAGRLSQLQRGMITLATRYIEADEPEFHTLGHAIQFLRDHHHSSVNHQSP